MKTFKIMENHYFRGFLFGKHKIELTNKIKNNYDKGKWK